MTKGPQLALEAFPKLLSRPCRLLIDGPRVGASIRSVKVRTGRFCLRLSVPPQRFRVVRVLVLHKDELS
jgi:hypothetical protein